MLGYAYGIRSEGFGPVGAAEHRRKNRIKRAPLFEPEASVARSASWARAGFSEERREPRGTCAVGPAAGSAFLLVRFLWRSKENELALQGETEIRSSDKEYVGRALLIQCRARESTSPEGAKPANKKESTSRQKGSKQNNQLIEATSHSYKTCSCRLPTGSTLQKIHRIQIVLAFRNSRIPSPDSSRP